ncbi:MAG TPA: hypothetical protein DCX54_03475 [Flavobacteriales bacterium]|nr:hypothetical protein [Flavobacteriales bacterium]
MTYLISAIQKIDANIGQEALEILQSSQNPTYEVILCLLINEISQTSEHISLILDDYHFINDEQVHKIISFLVDYMPRFMHLVVSTRLDPPLSLTRMRAHRELVEIRSKDLRLTLEETAVILNDVMGFALTMEDVKSLDERVEGWAASLYMAALSMQGTKDVSRFIKTFTGSNRFILDYLMEEVLGKETAEVKDFLLRTSIVERMNASLCNSILDKEDNQQILSQLERSNTFLIPLDNEQIWYRYHHLFADLLQKRLMNIHPTQISNLHTRASIWYDEESLLTEAISHALKGEDLDRVANLVEKYGFAVTSFNQEKTLSSWLELLPVDVVRNRPWLCILQAWLHYSFGPRAKAEDYLEIAESLIVQAPSTNETSPAPHFSSSVDQQRIKGAIASIRAHISITEGHFQPY